MECSHCKLQLYSLGHRHGAPLIYWKGKDKKQETDKLRKIFHLLWFIPQMSTTIKPNQEPRPPSRSPTWVPERPQALAVLSTAFLCTSVGSSIGWFNPLHHNTGSQRDVSNCTASLLITMPGAPLPRRINTVARECMEYNLQPKKCELTGYCYSTQLAMTVTDYLHACWNNAFIHTPLRWFHSLYMSGTLLSS